jgi:hypothetical protein
MRKHQNKNRHGIFHARFTNRSMSMLSKVCASSQKSAILLFFSSIISSAAGLIAAFIYTGNVAVMRRSDRFKK